MQDYYRWLSVSRHASTAEIKKAYRAAALFWHPDKNKSPQAHQKFIDITEAYNILIDAHKRKVYDQLFQEENQVVLRPQPKVHTANTTTQKATQRKAYEEWVKEERAKAEKLSRFSSDQILTDSFHFLDQYGWAIVVIMMIVIMIIAFSIKK